VKRFIEPAELARDRRFKRAQSRDITFDSLPEDVNEIVRRFEQAAPAIQARARGTALERVYEELGPAYQILTRVGSIRPDDALGSMQLRMRFHGIFVGELQALEAAGRTLWDFPEAPCEFKMNMARQCWDEARHVQIYEKLLQHAGGAVGEFPETTFLFETSCADDPVLRVTGVNRCLEGLACDVFRNMIDLAERQGDPIIRQAVDFVLADELTHVRFGSDWVREFTRNDPERRKRAQEFQRETDRTFAFGGRRMVARDVRLEAGFTEEEIAELEAMGGDAPRRDTLLRAAELLRERHQARRRGEPVPALEGA
jgi:uncharacterized ferritin-like protein (DUF455 family)